MVAIERKFIADNIRKLEVKEYLKKELDRAGCGEIDLQRTPLGTRVIVNAQRPGIVIGRKGTSIRKLTAILKSKYDIDNPQIEVNELDVPELNAKVMSKNIASSLERGIHFRRAAYTTLRRIMDAGARGAEIQISGKLTGERAKSLKFTDGYLKHCGEPATKYVRVGIATANPKPGVLGVKVKIMPPDVKLPDDIDFITSDVAEVEEGGDGVEKKVEVEKAGEKIEELVEDIQEELEIVDGGEVPKTKKLKPEKIKRKKIKKKSKADEEPGEEPDDLEGPDETAPEKPGKEEPGKEGSGKEEAMQKPTEKIEKEEKAKIKPEPKKEESEPSGDSKK